MRSAAQGRTLDGCSAGISVEALFEPLGWAATILALGG
jgi:hypothetical protein